MVYNSGSQKVVGLERLYKKLFINCVYIYPKKDAKKADMIEHKVRVRSYNIFAIATYPYFIFYIPAPLRYNKVEISERDLLFEVSIILDISAYVEYY